MRPGKSLLYGAAALACALYGTVAQADPFSGTLYFTTFTGGTGSTPNVGMSPVTLSGAALTVNPSFIASTPGADGIIFNPFTPAFSNLLVGGQSGAGTPGGPCGGASPCTATNPATVSNVLATGAHTVTTFGTTPGVGAANNGAYALASGPNPFGAGTVVFALCNGPGSPCGAKMSVFNSAGGTGANVTVTGGNAAGVTGLPFDPVNSKWYYSAAPDSWRTNSGIGEFGTVAFGSGNTATLTPLSVGGVSNLPGHDVFFDPFTGDIFINAGNQVDQIDPATNTLVGQLTLATTWQFDSLSVDGKGHLFIASNTVVGGNNLVGLDYDCAAPVVGGFHPCSINGITPGFAFLANNLDDVAPQTAPPMGTPEPASLALLGSALVGFGLLRRRRNHV